MSRDEDKLYVFMSIAVTLSTLGTCDRKHVGAVFVKDGRCVTWGYNGAPPGAPHCEDTYHGHREAYMEYRNLVHQSYMDVSMWMDYNELGCVNVTHAEANALAFAARHGISTDGATLFVTVSPCDPCSRLLIAAGIETVYYKEEYRDGRGLDILRDAGISCSAL